MEKNPNHKADRPAISELKDLVRVFLRRWEDTDELPSEAAERLVSEILRFHRIEEARADFLRECGHLD
jgi:hypothetical protein